MNSSFVDFEVNEHNVNLNVYKNRQSLTILIQICTIRDI